MPDTDYIGQNAILGIYSYSQLRRTMKEYGLTEQAAIVFTPTPVFEGEDRNDTDFDETYVENYAQVLQDAEWGEALRSLVAGIGDRQRAYRKFEQLHRVGARTFGSRWLWANGITSERYHLLGLDDLPSGLRIYAQLGASLMAWTLCAKTAPTDSVLGRGGKRWMGLGYRTGFWGYKPWRRVGEPR